MNKGDDTSKALLIDRILGEAMKDNLFTEAELARVKQALEAISLEELVHDYLPRWYQDLWRWKPVGVREWVTSPEYMNVQSMYPMLLDDFEELFEGGYQEAVFEGSIGFGKCLTGDTQVYLSHDGKSFYQARLDSVMAKTSVMPLYTLGLDDRTLKVVPAEIINAKCNGFKDVYRVRLASGRVLRGTAEHPVRTAYGYTLIKHLTEGQLVATARSLPFDGKPVDPNLVKWLAYMTAEGCTVNTGTSIACNFTNADPELVAEFQAVTEALGGTMGAEAPRGKATTYQVKGLRPLLREHGLAGHKAVEKRVPEIIMQADRASIGLFLSRFIACDGHLTGHARQIEVGLGSQGLVHDLRELFLRLGIHSRYREKQVGSHNVYLLSVSGADVAAFLREFPMIGEKAKRARAIIDQVVTRPSSNTDVVPVDYAAAKDIRKRLGGLPKHEWRKYLDMPKGQYLSREKLTRARDHFVTLTEPYDRLVDSDVFWDRVVAVEYDKVELVYDIQVPRTHNFIANGVVAHNSFLSAMAICRMLYELSCFKEPQLGTGIAPGTPIVLFNVATKEKVAKDIVFGNVQTFVRGSPYFLKHFPPDKDLTSELVFPNKVKVVPAASTQGSIIGQNIYGGVLDEVNFLFKGESVRSGTLNDEFDLAKVLWNAARRRIKSRFGNKHKGILITISSSMFPDDFTSWRKKDADKNNERIFYRRYSQWEPKPEYKGFDQDPKRYFWLSIGDLSHRPRIIRQPDHKDYDELLDDVTALEEAGVKLVKVPTDFKLEFERDIDMAVRDIAGYATQSSYPFFRNLQAVMDAVSRGNKRGLKHPWSLETTTLRDNSAWIKERLDTTKRQRQHFAHVDLALTQDAAGISVVRLDGIEEEVVETPIINELTNEVQFEKMRTYRPKLTTVLMLRVISTGGLQIPIAQVRQRLMDLINWGFNLTKVTYDSFQSAESIQAFEQLAVEADYLSVDRTLEPYNALREAIEDGRLDMYDYPPALKEFAGVEYDVKKKKVDHAPKASKDVTDSLAGAVFNATSYVRDNEDIVVPGDVDDDMPAPPMTYGEDPQDIYPDDVSYDAALGMNVIYGGAYED